MQFLLLQFFLLPFTHCHWGRESMLPFLPPSSTHEKSAPLFYAEQSQRSQPFASHMLQSLNHLHGCSLTLLWCVLASHSGGLRPRHRYVLPGLTGESPPP